MTFEVAIRAALANWSAQPVRYGIDDCCLCIADIYVAVLGIDPAAPWRGRYRTKIGARRVLGKRGIVAAVAGACRKAGWKRVKPAIAKTGDLGLVETPEGPACAIRYAGRWHGHIDFGFAAHADDNVLFAWSVH